jgi:hypothetical protein
MTRIISAVAETVIRQSCPLHGTANQAAHEAAKNARQKGWQVWVEYDQCDVLDQATVVARRRDSRVYIVARFLEEEETVYRATGNHQEVLQRWLSRCDAYPIPE